MEELKKLGDESIVNALVFERLEQSGDLFSTTKCEVRQMITAEFDKSFTDEAFKENDERGVQSFYETNFS